MKTLKSTSNMQPKLMENLPKVLHVNHPDALAAARQALLDGEVIAVPTDTVYGLACDATNENAVQKLYKIKGRGFQKPVAICVRSFDAFRHYSKSSHLPDKLLERLLPGPITVVVDRSPNLINSLNPQSSRIGIRIPDFPFLQKLNALYEQPFALTSANRSGEPSTLNINEFNNLWLHLARVFDGGQLGIGENQRSASTVVDLSAKNQYKIIREGVALKETLDVIQSLGIECVNSY